MIPVRVFTHPMCTGCATAIQLAQRLRAQDPEVEVRYVSLASAPGRAEATAERILVVPVVFVGAIRFDGVPEWGELLAAVEASRGADGGRCPHGSSAAQPGAAPVREPSTGKQGVAA